MGDGQAKGRARSIAIAVIAMSFGLGIYYYDDWCDTIRSPWVKWTSSFLEIIVMGPAMGALAFLVCENIRSKEGRFQERVANEREGRFRFLGRIAASVAHEIRNPLHNVHLLCAELRQAASPEVADLVDRIRSNLDRLEQANVLIYELAKPQRRDAAEGSPHVADAVASAVAALADLDGDGIAPRRVAHVPPTGPLQVNGRAEALRISLHNLLRNAVEAAGDGEVALSYHDLGDRVELQIRNPGDLRDEAIDGADDGHDSGKPGGLGVGIAISRQLLAAYGASIRYESGSGTVLTRVVLRKAA